MGSSEDSLLPFLLFLVLLNLCQVWKLCKRYNAVFHRIYLKLAACYQVTLSQNLIPHLAFYFNRLKLLYIRYIPTILLLLFDVLLCK